MISRVEVYNYSNGAFCLHHRGTTTQKTYSEMQLVTALVLSTTGLTISLHSVLNLSMVLGSVFNAFVKTIFHISI
jgi:hypothetical protein